MLNTIERFGKILAIKAFKNASSCDSLTYNTIIYLDIISYSDKNTVSSLAKSLSISKSAVTLKINELMKLGLVKKETSSEDKRIHYISLSDDIKDFCSDDDFECIVSDTKTKFSPEKINAFIEILDFISENLETE